MSFMASLSYNVAGEIVERLEWGDGRRRYEFRRTFGFTAALVALACLHLRETAGLMVGFRPLASRGVGQLAQPRPTLGEAAVDLGVGPVG